MRQNDLQVLEWVRGFLRLYRISRHELVRELALRFDLDPDILT
jgi:hypothetical protein